MKRFALIQAADNKYIDCKWPDACASCHSSRIEKYHTPNDIYDRFVFANDMPYVDAAIELEEGPRMLGMITGCELEDVKVDMPVEVYFEDVTDEFALPKFKPAT